MWKLSKLSVLVALAALPSLVQANNYGDVKFWALPSSAADTCDVDLTTTVMAGWRGGRACCCLKWKLTPYSP
jgi:hypothetical protein